MNKCVRMVLEGRPNGERGEGMTKLTFLQGKGMRKKNGKVNEGVGCWAEIPS